jgi:hypothetical protein
MGQRVNVLWGIVIALLAACVVWIGYSNYAMSKQVDKLRQQKIVLGTDAQLEETVSTLEKSLDERLEHQAKVTNDPFDLTKVIQSRSFLQSLGLRETLEQQGRMRLSCTVVGDGSAAVVKFMGSSHVIRPGDVFNGFTVESITPQQVVLSKSGARLVLMNEAAPESEYSDGLTGRTSVSGQNY